MVTTSALGSVTIYENEVINLPSFSISSGLGTVSTVAKATVTITDSLVITNSLGAVLIWGEIDQSQTASYSTIDESQTPSYDSIDESQTADWQEVA